MSESTDTQSALGKMKLCIEDDEGVRATYPLLHSEVKLGRDPDVNHICLAQRNISREHVVIYVQPESSSLIVQDLDSYTGIKVNGKRVFGRSQLRLGDYLNIGDYGVMLEVDGKDTLSRAAVQQRHEEEISILPQEHHARLVAVSNNLAGREYLLNRTEMMIGRDHDNDIPINHRSISQSHAKVIWSRGSFKIVDLSSTNGMKVNGEQFGSFNLTRGAVVQLGNVKLRYVEPGEQYQNKLLINDEIYASEIDGSSPIKRWALIAIVFTVIFFMSRFIVMRVTESSITNDPATDIPSQIVAEDPVNEGEIQGETQGEAQGDIQGETQGSTQEAIQGEVPEETSNSSADYDVIEIDEDPQDGERERETATPAEDHREGSVPSSETTQSDPRLGDPSDSSLNADSTPDSDPSKSIKTRANPSAPAEAEEAQRDDKSKRSQQ